MCDYGRDVEGISIDASSILNYPTFCSLRKAFDVEDDSVDVGTVFFRKQEAQHLIKIAEGTSSFDNEVNNINKIMHHATVMLGAIILHVMQRDLPQPVGEEVSMALLKRLLPVDVEQYKYIADAEIEYGATGGEEETNHVLNNLGDTHIESVPSTPCISHGPAPGPIGLLHGTDESPGNISSSSGRSKVGRFGEYSPESDIFHNNTTKRNILSSVNAVPFIPPPHSIDYGNSTSSNSNIENTYPNSFSNTFTRKGEYMGNNEERKIDDGSEKRKTRGG